MQIYTSIHVRAKMESIRLVITNTPIMRLFLMGVGLNYAIEK